MAGIDWDADVLAPVMGVFGAPVTYRPRGGTPFTIPDAVYDSQYGRIEVDPSTGAEGVSSRVPALGVRASAFPSPPLQNDSVDVPQAGARFVVTNVQPDSHGHLLLILGKRSAL